LKALTAVIFSVINLYDVTMCSLVYSYRILSENSNIFRVEGESRIFFKYMVFSLENRVNMLYVVYSESKYRLRISLAHP